MATDGKTTRPTTASKPLDWNAIGKAARAGARSVRGLTAGDYEDCEQTGLAKLLEATADAAVANPQAYARKIARNAALAALRRQTAEPKAAPDIQSGSPSDGRDERAGVREAVLRAVDHLRSMVEHEVHSGGAMRNPERLARRTRSFIEAFVFPPLALLCPKLKLSCSMVREEDGSRQENSEEETPEARYEANVAAFVQRATRLDPGSGHWIESDGTLAFAVPVRGRRAPGPVDELPAQHFRRLRRQAARFIASYALQLAGLPATELNGLEAPRRGPSQLVRRARALSKTRRQRRTPPRDNAGRWTKPSK